MKDDKSVYPLYPCSSGGGRGYYQFNEPTAYILMAGRERGIKPVSCLILSFIIIGTRKERIRHCAREIPAPEEHG